MLSSGGKWWKNNGRVVLNSGGSGGMAWSWPLMLHGSAPIVVLWRALAKTGGARAYRGSSDSGGKSGGNGRMAWTWPLMMHGSASVVVLWRALAETGRASARRSSGDSCGSGWMARTWPRMLSRSVSVVVVWSAGLVCLMGVRSASLVVVEL